MPEEPILNWTTLFAGWGDQLLSAAPVVVPIGLTVFAALAGLGIALRFARKAGVR